MQNAVKKDIDKKELRKEVLAVRDNMPEPEWQEKSRRIEVALMKLPEFQLSEHILCYVNYKREVKTLSLIEKSLALGKHVYCPVVCKKAMEFYEIFSVEELESGYHGILEPKLREEKRRFSMPIEGNCFMVMPGAVFDSGHHRIGYGGGYYDRYLAEIAINSQKKGMQGDKAELFAVAVAFSFQIKDRIPYEIHDVCPQIIVTENGIIK